jgi:hypothetical protein
MTSVFATDAGVGANGRACGVGGGGLPCGAAEFLRAHGPSAVPLHACCAAALIGAGNGDVGIEGGVGHDGTTPRSRFPCAAALLAAAVGEGPS